MKCRHEKCCNPVDFVIGGLLALQDINLHFGNSSPCQLDYGGSAKISGQSRGPCNSCVKTAGEVVTRVTWVAGSGTKHVYLWVPFTSMPAHFSKSVSVAA